MERDGRSGDRERVWQVRLVLGVTSALRLSLILVSHSLETSEVSPRISHCCNSEVGMAPSGISGLLARVQKSFFGW